MMAPDGAPPPAVVEYGSLTELLLPLYIPAFLSQASRGATLTALPLHVLSLGFSYDDLGVLAMVTGIGLVIGNIPAGSMTTVRGPRFTLLVSCLLFCGSAGFSSIAALAPRVLTMPCFVAAFFLAGVAEAVAVLARQTFMGAVVQSSLRGRVASMQGGVQRLAFVFGTSAGGAVAQSFGAHATYALQALLAVACGAGVAFGMPFISASQNLGAKTAAGAKPAAAQGASLSMCGVLRAHWRLLFVASAFTGCAFFIRKARELLFSMEGHERDMSQAEVGRMAALSYLIDGVLFPVGGYLLDTIGRTQTGTLSFALMALAFLALQSGSSSSMLGFAIIGGVSNGVSSGLALTVGADLAPPDCRGNFLAVFRMLARSADPAAASMLGVLAETASLRVAELAVCLVAVGGIACAMCCMPETLVKSPPATASARKGYAAVAPEGAAAATIGKSAAAAPAQEDLEELSPTRKQTIRRVGAADEFCEEEGRPDDAAAAAA